MWRCLALGDALIGTSSKGPAAVSWSMKLKMSSAFGLFFNELIDVLDEVYT